MTLKTYLAIAMVAFVAAVTGSDLVARMTVGDLPFREAFKEHLEWASLTLVGLLSLLAPFVCVAVICGKTNVKARTRSVGAIFVSSLLALGYFYFGAFQAAEQAMLDERWTAAAFSIGLLPFFVGLPLVLLSLGAALTAARFDPRPYQPPIG
jgi:hypothetical protein